MLLIDVRKGLKHAQKKPWGRACLGEGKGEGGSQRGADIAGVVRLDVQRAGVKQQAAPLHKLPPVPGLSRVAQQRPPIDAHVKAEPSLGWVHLHPIVWEACACTVPCLLHFCAQLYLPVQAQIQLPTRDSTFILLIIITMRSLFSQCLSDSRTENSTKLRG